jgi:hypothetical protein
VHDQQPPDVFRHDADPLTLSVSRSVSLDRPSQPRPERFGTLLIYIVKGAAIVASPDAL